MFKHALIPLDGSQTSERVLPRLVPLLAPQAIRHLVSVVPGDAGSSPSAFERVRLLESESYLAFMAAELAGTVRTDVRRGDAVSQILAAATASGADLIALSTHGEAARASVPFGSVAAGLLLGATCPVLVFGALSAESGPPPSRPRRILVALDGSAESEASLVPARGVAAAWGADLVLLHVVEPTWAASDSMLAEQIARDTEATHRRLRELADGLGREGLKARALLSHGEPAQEILAQATRREAGLVCLSTAGRGTMGRMLFGSVARKLIGALSVPALIVRVSPARPG